MPAPVFPFRPRCTRQAPENVKTVTIMTEQPEEAIETRSCTFDEIAAMCRDAAAAKGYPPQLAEFAGEMVVWLERHRIPGVAAMALVLEKCDAYDPKAAAPETLESGEMRFPEPITGGMFLLNNFGRLTFPARVNGPTYGAMLLVPFFALAAHQQEKGIRISFLQQDGETVGAQVSYEGGKSAFAGEPIAVGYASKIGVEFPVEFETDLNPPRDGPVEIDAGFFRALSGEDPTRH